MGVFNAAGSRLSKSAALALFTADNSNPPLIATADLYESVHTGREDLDPDGSERRLLVRNGQVISTAEFNKLFPTPTVDTIAPSAALPVAGGTTVTVTGALLDGITAVSVGGTAATSVVYSQAGKKLTFATPAKTAGTYSVVLTDDSGSVTLTNALTFQ